MTEFEKQAGRAAAVLLEELGPNAPASVVARLAYMQGVCAGLRTVGPSAWVRESFRKITAEATQRAGEKIRMNVFYGKFIRKVT